MLGSCWEQCFYAQKHLVQMWLFPLGFSCYWIVPCVEWFQRGVRRSIPARGGWILLWGRRSLAPRVLRACCGWAFLIRRSGGAVNGRLLKGELAVAAGFEVEDEGAVADATNL